MNSYWEKWFRAAAVRAVKTAALTAIATIGSTAMFTGVSWAAAGSAALLTGALSLLTSAAGLPEVER